MRKRFIIGLLLALAAWNVNMPVLAHDDALFHPVEIKDGSSLTVTDCVANAFKNSPRIKRKKYALDIAKSNVGIARSSYFPVINAGVGLYNENNSNNREYANHFREFPNVGVSINKMVYDFGKTTSYIKMEEFYKIGAEYEFMDSVCWTLFDIKYKYYDVLKAKALMQIRENDVELNKNFVKIAKSDADLATAKLNLSNAEVQYLVAEDEYLNAKVDLNNSMYLVDQKDFEIQNTGTFDFENDYAYTSSPRIPEEHKEYNLPFDRNDAVDIAYKSNPDLRVLEATKNAMGESLKFIKRTYFPSLNASAGYGYNDTNMKDSNNSLRVGVNLNSNVNLMQLKHSIKGADAQLSMADNEITLFKQDLFYRIKKVFNIYDRAEKQIPVSQLEAKQALENLKIVEAQYKSGSLNYVALQEARKDYINSVIGYVNSLYDYNMSIIEIERAMHYHIVDIHHRTEHAVEKHSGALIEHFNEVLGCDKYNTQDDKKENKQKSDL